MPATSAQDAREPDAAEALGALPEWDLGDLYAAPDAPEIARDLDWLAAECAAFAADYEGRLADLDAAGLLAAIRRYERIQTVSGRIMSYAGLRYFQNTTDAGRGKFFGDMQGRITDLSAPLVFFALELNRVEDAALDARLAENADLARYRPRMVKIEIGSLPPDPRPHPQDEALPAFRRAGEIPARPVRGRRRGLEPPLRRDVGRDDI